MKIFNSDEQELLERIRLAKAQSIAFLNSDKQPTKRMIGAPVKKKLNSKSGEECPICKEKMKLSKRRQTPLDNTEATVEHILDLALGGNNKLENFMIICNRCNEVNNQLMQEYLKIEIADKRLLIGSLDWRKELRTSEKKILKLFQYIEWCLKLGQDSAKGEFTEIDTLFSKYRYGKISPVLPIKSPSILIKIISYFGRLISGFGKSESKNLSNSSGPSVRIEETEQDSQRTPEEIDFTPEEFSRTILQMSREFPVFFGQTYGYLISNHSRFNLSNYNISPNEYLRLHCSDFLEIEERPDKVGQIHYWISPKKKAIGAKISLDASKIIEDSRKRAQKNSEKEIAKIRREFTNTNTHTIEDPKSRFRKLIFEIFSENETNRLSLSALGVRMSRKVQDEGYQNSKEYFQSVHGSSMTISEALNSYFTNEEIRFTGIRQIRNGMGTMKYTHVELHRRD